MCLLEHLLAYLRTYQEQKQAHLHSHFRMKDSEQLSCLQTILPSWFLGGSSSLQFSRIDPLSPSGERHLDTCLLCGGGVLATSGCSLELGEEKRDSGLDALAGIAFSGLELIDSAIVHDGSCDSLKCGNIVVRTIQADDISQRPRNLNVVEQGCLLRCGDSYIQERAVQKVLPSLRVAEEIITSCP
jgi:hypothetical protein